MHDVLFPSGEEIIHYDHAIASVNQTVHQMAPNEPSTTSYDDSQTLPLQPQRDFPAGIEGWEPGDMAVLIYDPVGLGRLGGEIRVGNGGVGGGEEGEYKGGDGNAHKNEHQALLPEHVPNRPNHAQPRFRRLR
ncbi:unnamed protein product [Fraxinus pennsylvanica]|uniref:Uncharacterized protein n=1 Tax=Fraxinus pennsylvanica TaxID=56036 RepID=A0AAD2A775_9LAMI|nr:unnamed protein product [Fraxinus pennsylvanica]